MSTLYWDGTESETPMAESYSKWCLRLFIFFANENSEGEMSRLIKFTLMDGGMSEVLLSAKCFWVLSSYHLTPLLPDVWRMFLHLNSLCSSKNPCVGISKYCSLEFSNRKASFFPFRLCCTPYKVYRFSQLIFFHLLLLSNLHISCYIVHCIWVPTRSDLWKQKLQIRDFLGDVSNWGIADISFVCLILTAFRPVVIYHHSFWDTLDPDQGLTVPKLILYHQAARMQRH